MSTEIDNPSGSPSAWTDGSEDDLGAVALQAFRAGVPEPRRRAALLSEIADNLDANRELVREVAGRETSLTSARLDGEIDRTAYQLRLYGQYVAAGHAVQAIIDTTRPSSVVAGPDLRRMAVPIGPVAVFPASNFPLAFGVIGTDTASALAAGCPAIIKGHPYHPDTTSLLSEFVHEALARQRWHRGWFSVIEGGPSVAQDLVRNPAVRAVGFTGSFNAGRALFDVAAARPEPIPVYAEMSGINPMLITEAALHERGTELAKQLAGVLLASGGQLCTKPGLLMVPAGPHGERFIAQLVEFASTSDSGFPLAKPIMDTFVSRIRDLGRITGVQVKRTSTTAEWTPHVIEVTPSVLTSNQVLLEEIFGPAAVVLRYDNFRQVEETLALISGTLTASVQGTEDELASLAPILHDLTNLAGRLVWNDIPTGVRVGHATTHGGPYPATTFPATTSVGTGAVHRFLRPVVWQSMPPCALPPELRDENPDNLLRLVDGEWTTEPLG